MPVVAMPLTKCFCKRKKTIRMGSRAMMIAWVATTGPAKVPALG